MERQLSSKQPSNDLFSIFPVLCWAYSLSLNVFFNKNWLITQWSFVSRALRNEQKITCAKKKGHRGKIVNRYWEQGDDWILESFPFSPPP